MSFHRIVRASRACICDRSNELLSWGLASISGCHETRKGLGSRGMMKVLERNALYLTLEFLLRGYQTSPNKKTRLYLRLSDLRAVAARPSDALVRGCGG